MNNAGIQHVAPVENFPAREVGRDHRHQSQRVVPHDPRGAAGDEGQKGWGRIINIASTHGLVASTHKVAYVAAKHGIIGLTKVMGIECADTGVTCNAICPGWVSTPLAQAQIEAKAQGRQASAWSRRAHLLIGEKQPQVPVHDGRADRGAGRVPGLGYRVQHAGHRAGVRRRLDRTIRRSTVADAKFLKPDTLALHAGQHPDPVTGARAVPIYQTTSFVFRDVDHAASLFNLEVGGHIYSRISNPTVAVFEERVAALEEGSGALGVASGQAALHIAIATLMGAGGHIVASTSLYGGTRNMLALTLPRFGIETTFVNPRDHDGFAKAIRPETRLVLGETIGNPGGEVLDIPAIAAIAHAAEDPADDRQYLRLAGALPAAHAWAPTSSSIRPPSSSAAMAWRSAA